MPRYLRTVSWTSLQRPVLIWDGDCGFCAGLIQRWRKVLWNHVDTIPYQKVFVEHPDMGIPEVDFQKTVHLLEPVASDTGNKSATGQQSVTVYTGAAAVFRAIHHHRAYGLLWKLYYRLPPFAWVMELGYRFVARNRSWISRLPGIPHCRSDAG